MLSKFMKSSLNYIYFYIKDIYIYIYIRHALLCMTLMTNQWWYYIYKEDGRKNKLSLIYMMCMFF